MARDVFVDHSCGYFDNILDRVSCMKNAADKAKDEVESTVGHLEALVKEIDMDSDDEGQILGGLEDILRDVEELEFSDEESDCEWSVENAREVNSNLRGEAECFGVEADQFENQAENLQNIVYNKEKEVTALEQKISELEDGYGKNIRQPEWQFR